MALKNVNNQKQVDYQIRRVKEEVFIQEWRNLNGKQKLKVAGLCGLNGTNLKELESGLIAYAKGILEKQKGEKMETAEKTQEASPPVEVEKVQETSPPENSRGITMEDLKEDRKIKAVVARPSQDDRDRLKKSMEKDGFDLTERITCLADGTLVDGHTRLEVAKELGIVIPPGCIEILDVPKEDIDKIKAHIRRKNLDRRMLTPAEIMEAYIKIYPEIFKDKKASTVDKKASSVEGQEPATEEAPAASIPSASGERAGKGRATRIAEITGLTESQVRNWFEVFVYCPDLVQGIREKGWEDMSAAASEIRKERALCKEYLPKDWQKIKAGADLNLKKLDNDIRAYMEACYANTGEWGCTSKDIEEVYQRAQEKEKKKAPKRLSPVARKLKTVIERFETAAKRHYRAKEFAVLLDDSGNGLSAPLMTFYEWLKKEFEAESE